MNRNYFSVIGLMALASLILIVFFLWEENKTTPIAPPVILQAHSPFPTYISGVGVAEPKSENILIGTPVNRVVEKVLVTPGKKVKKGDWLFCLEDRDLKAELLSKQVAYKSALAKVQRLEALPRPEDLISKEAALKSSQAELDLARSQYEMVERLPDPRAISQEERERRFTNLKQATAKWEEANSELNKVKAGVWGPDLEIAKLEVLQSEANMKRIEADIERTIIRSPIDGTVLQVKIHEGESLPDPNSTPMMIVGNLDEIYLKVSINQFDIPYFHKHAPAVAFLQGNAKIKYPLEFVQVEPFLVSKQNLTNSIKEKVDTRVLQIIYRIKAEGQPIFVGQQFDVFIATHYPENEKENG